MYRQGDLLLVSVETIDSAATPVARDRAQRLVLAEGESTGHAHVVLAPDVALVEARRVRYIQSPKPFEITHEEHAPLRLPAGTFRVVHQREYAPEAIRKVRD